MRRNWINFAFPLTTLAALAAWFFIGDRSGGVPAPEPAYFQWQGSTPTDRVELLAMGDWGDGGYGQDTVAIALTQYVRTLGVEFHGLLSAGDNFYVSIDGPDDRRWRTLFEEKYDHRVLNFPFYCVLGNHDHEGNVEKTELKYARENPKSRFKMPARHYRVDLPIDKPLLSVLALDSTKPEISKKAWEEQTEWLETQFRSITDGRWVIVLAHHPLFSNGAHGDNTTLQKDWGPLLQKNTAHFLVNGHDHNLQHLEMENWPTSFLIVGGGGRPISTIRRQKYGPFSRSLNGFAHLSLDAQMAEVRFIDATSGHVVHHFRRVKSQPVQIVSTTGRDTPVFDPVGSVKDLATDEWSDLNLGLESVKETLDWRKLKPTRPTMQPAE